MARISLVPRLPGQSFSRVLKKIGEPEDGASTGERGRKHKAGERVRRDWNRDMQRYMVDINILHWNLNGTTCI